MEKLILGATSCLFLGLITCAINDPLSSTLSTRCLHFAPVSLPFFFIFFIDLAGQRVLHTIIVIVILTSPTRDQSIIPLPHPLLSHPKNNTLPRCGWQDILRTDRIDA
ncbi:uncharacterized protein BO97DRAFT_25160 [Aspergillus homomorphus CBS 101889]|uniref:Uncharacterized protein n=1 Tax=Aspergillus homomorphus (strain CBS 101889) TaxID=1450537 RepID=A0A395I134_ASPHC|nr:hypothetical protein BO97DRAFT_25160 [Aspergillus homomorphus CBS 101889]RAL13770.1 hypothetical protein BO97DRAFT_25160 [Aspergillus homomorphus CBS 101889]